MAVNSPNVMEPVHSPCVYQEDRDAADQYGGESFTPPTGLCPSENKGEMVGVSPTNALQLLSSGDAARIDPSSDDFTDHCQSQPEAGSQISSTNPSVENEALESDATKEGSDFFFWTPAPTGASTVEERRCPFCELDASSREELVAHVHRDHINPKYLCPTVVDNLCLSSKLTVNAHEDAEELCELTALYRCHLCFNVFNKSDNLKLHLVQHSSDRITREARGTPSSEAGSQPAAQEPEDCTQRLTTLPSKSTKMPVSDCTPKFSKMVETPPSELKSTTCRRSLRKRSNLLGNSTTVHRRLQRSSSSGRSENHDDDESAYERDAVSAARDGEQSPLAVRKSDRPQRMCKVRTKTLVAISLAEQDYEKFDLDFSKMKTDVNASSGTPQRGDAIDIKKLQEAVLNARNAADSESESDDSVESMPVQPDERSEPGKKSQIQPQEETAASKQETPLKEPTIRNGKPKSTGKDKQPAKSKPSPAPKKPKNRPWKLPIKDLKKANELVTDITFNHGDYVCLSCSRGFQSYGSLKVHKSECGHQKKQIFVPKKVVANDHQELMTPELSEYITGSVTRIPETSFNHLHGKLPHLQTVDGQAFQTNPPNALGLVKLNYSGEWSAADVWERAGWEPRPGHLSWQQYELASFMHHSNHSVASPLRLPNGEDAHPACENGVSGESAPTEKGPCDTPTKSVKPHKLNGSIDHPQPETGHVDEKKCPGTLSSPNTTLAKTLTRRINDRQDPVIVANEVDRSFVIRMAQLSWSDQKHIKANFDTVLSSKKSRRSERGPSEASHRTNNNLMGRMELKQISKSVKYSRGQQDKATNNHQPKPRLIAGELSGEWEIDHLFVCSVCGVGYDDVLEIMHHKWEAHPHCLVAHVSLKESLQRPPALMYPQVGPSKVIVDATQAPSAPPTLKCSKCEEAFSSAQDFHIHILLCGGVAPWDYSSTKRKKRKGHGGGLKSTIRFIHLDSQKQAADRPDGDDTPVKKKPRPPPKVFAEPPLVPTHNRTTRFKELKVKEAKLLAAREKRQAAKRNKIKANKTHGSEPSKKKKAQSSDQKVVAQVVRNLVETVHFKERLRSRTEPPKTPANGTEQGVKAANAVRSTRSSNRLKDNQAASKQESAASSRENSPTRVTLPKEPIIANSVPDEVLLALDDLLEAVITHSQLSRRCVMVKMVPDDQTTCIVNQIRTNQSESGTSPLKRQSKKRSRSPSLDSNATGHDLSLESPSRRSKLAKYPEEPELAVAASDIENNSDGSQVKQLNQVQESLENDTGVEKVVNGKQEKRSMDSIQDVKSSTSNCLISEEPTIKNGLLSKHESLKIGNNRYPKNGQISNIEDHLKTDKETREAQSVKCENTQPTINNNNNEDASGLKDEQDKPQDGKKNGILKAENRKQDEDMLVEDFSSHNGRSSEIVETVGAEKVLPARKRGFGLNSPYQDTGRLVMPLEVKREALRKVMLGESQARVARDLDIPISTISSWWRRKSSIMNGCDATEFEFKDHSVDELVAMENGVASASRSPDRVQSRQATPGPDNVQENGGDLKLSDRGKRSRSHPSTPSRSPAKHQKSAKLINALSNAANLANGFHHGEVGSDKEKGSADNKQVNGSQVMNKQRIADFKLIKRELLKSMKSAFINGRRHSSPITAISSAGPGTPSAAVNSSTDAEDDSQHDKKANGELPSAPPIKNAVGESKQSSVGLCLIADSYDSSGDDS